MQGTGTLRALRRLACALAAGSLLAAACEEAPRPGREGDPVRTTRPGRDDDAVRTTRPGREQPASPGRGSAPVTVKPVETPVREAAPEDVVEEAAGPPVVELTDDDAPGRTDPAVVPTVPAVEPGAESAKPERTLEELERALADEAPGREAGGGGAALDPLHAAILDAALSADASGEGPAHGPRAGAVEEAKARAAGAKPRLVVYAFESDTASQSPLGDPLGGKVADIVTGHAARSGFFQTFAELEQEDVLAAHPFAARYETSPAKIAAHARERFRADIVVWGRVRGERASPTLDVLALDLRRPGAQDEALTLRESYQCPSLHYIPTVADRILESLAGRPLKAAEVRVTRRVGANLVRNGSFSTGGGRRAPGWESPLPEGASVEDGRLILRLTEQVATTHGLGVYNEWLRVEPGAHYELSCRSRQGGVTIIVWVRGYAEFPARTSGERGVDPRREAFRHQFRPASQADPDARGWMSVTSKPFRPRHFRHEIKWMRVRLYAFGGRAGTAEFDDVVLRKVLVEGDPEGVERREDGRMLKAFGEKAGGGGE